MTRPVDVDLINLLVARDGVLTKVVLSDGRTLAVMNVAWGYDDGDVHAHVTTNVSPSVLDVESDFFFTHEVASLIDPTTGRSLLDVRYA